MICLKFAVSIVAGAIGVHSKQAVQTSSIPCAWESGASRRNYIRQRPQGPPLARKIIGTITRYGNITGISRALRGWKKLSVLSYSRTSMKIARVLEPDASPHWRRGRSCFVQISMGHHAVSCRSTLHRSRTRCVVPYIKTNLLKNLSTFFEYITAIIEYFSKTTASRRECRTCMKKRSPQRGPMRGR